MPGDYKIAYWLRTDIQHFAHIRHIYETLGGVIFTKNQVIYDYLTEKHPSIRKDLILVKNSTEARKVMRKMNIKLVVYTGFQFVFWGYSVQVFHGASDKNYLVAQNRIRIYDLLLLPGEKHREKIVSAFNLKDPEQMKMVGYPKFDKLVNGTIEDSTVFSNGRPTVLYAPTWISQNSGTKLNFSDHGESSLLLWGIRLIRNIAPRWNLIIKYHSRVNKNFTEIYQQIDSCIIKLGLEDSVKVIWDSSITAYMAQADIMISDISAVCYEWFHTGRPIVFANPAPDHYKPSSDKFSNTYAWRAGDVLNTEEEIVSVIESNLKKDRYRDIRQELLTHSFYRPDGHATERQTVEIVKFYNKVKGVSRFRMYLHNLRLLALDSILHLKAR